jgi:threonine dehydrogenase-like Zn-dependent dehydrogenase
VWEEAIRLVATGRVNLRPLISRVFPLREAAQALALACAKAGVIKVQIDLQSS